jgi:ABC-type sugar transport system ATPase subunit
MDSQRTNGVPNATPVLEVRNAFKRFGVVSALNGVNLTLHRGEILGLLGDNGAGKSTLIKSITGVVRIDSGDILIDGVPVTVESPNDARAAGIEAVYQDLALFDNLDVVTNLYVGHELTRPRRLRALGWLDRKGMSADARERLNRLQVNLPDLAGSIGLMSGGQRQAIAVARAVAFARRVLILDEPTAALGLRETKNVLDTVRRLPQQGIAVILITHNMQHVLDLCDNAIVMRQGRVVGSERPNTESLQRIVSMIVGAQTNTGGAIG